jgi:malonyl-CoA decarboxylase
MEMDVSFFQEILAKISDQGRRILDLSSLTAVDDSGSLQELCQALVSSRGEASGVALASHILDLYRQAANTERDYFFSFLARHFIPDASKVQIAAAEYVRNPGREALESLMECVESPRQELFRRLNLAPGGTAALVRMRADLLKSLRQNPELASVDRDFIHLFSSWFNRGFLVLARLSWSSPASILEKIIAYEAVHKIDGWDDLRRRLDPRDRRCFAFFHPALVDDPLIFVEVALGSGIPASIRTLLNSGDAAGNAAIEPSAAIFYSISNCQEGLRGISFGNFLIKQVVEDLSRDIPSLRVFVTLSPLPGFRTWLCKALDAKELDYLTETQIVRLARLAFEGWREQDAQGETEPAMLAAAAHYLLLARDAGGKPLDPVARFHLGNGARLERINWLADTSDKGVQQSLSLMVNYRYDLKDIERNHEAYVNRGEIAASKSVRAYLPAPAKSRALFPAQE